MLCYSILRNSSRVECSSWILSDNWHNFAKERKVFQYDQLNSYKHSFDDVSNVPRLTAFCHTFSDFGEKTRIDVTYFEFFNLRHRMVENALPRTVNSKIFRGMCPSRIFRSGL